MSAQDKLDRSAAKHGLGSDERKRKIQKAKDFFSKPVPTYSKDELRKMGHPVEQKESSKVPAGMKFIASYVYKDAKGKKHTHRHLRKGSKMSDPIVVYIDDKEWKTFQSFTKAKQAAINHIKGMKESVETNEGRFDITFPEPTAKNTARKNPAATARNKAKTAKYKDKIQKATAKDKARSASGSLTRTDDHKRKNYQTGKAGAYFSKYESSAEYGKSMDRIRDKEKNSAIKPKDRDTLGKLADLMKKQKRNEAYRKPTQAEIDADKKKDGKGKDSSTRYRDMKKKVYGNAMGGLKDAAGQEYTAVPIKTGDVSQADRLTIAKMDAIMKKRSKDKRQKESVNLEENKIFFVKVGDGRDHMTVKVKASNSREALKKMRAQHPKNKVALDQNQKQGRSAGAFESVEMNESSLPPHLQKIIGKNGQIDKKKVDQHVHGKKTKVTDVTPKGYGPKEDVDEATMADRTVLRAVRVAKDMAGNHTGASKRIEKMKKGLSDHPKVKDALRLANESVSSADKKPQNFRDPETGKLKVRMVPVDRDVVRGNDAAKSVARKKRFKHMRKEQMATGNSQVGKSGRDAFMNAFKDIQKTAAEIQKKKDADKK
ncbi:hypothetical protein N9A42_00380 [bacterium]|nr:hypothetical protein [bacterium]